jgi:hypothetical protein
MIPQLRRRGSIYIAVVTVVAVVSTLTLTGVALRGQVNQSAVLTLDSSYAQTMAMGAVDLVLHQAWEDMPQFRQRAESGGLFSDVKVGRAAISAYVVDEDTGLVPTAQTKRYRVSASSKVGSARYAVGMSLDSPDDELRQLVRSIPGSVAYWPLDERDSSKAVEVLAGRHGEFSSSDISGQLTHTHGGPAPLMERWDEFVRIPHDPVYELNAGTLVFWVRFDDKPSFGQVCVVIDKKSDDPAQRLRIMLTGSVLRAIFDSKSISQTLEIGAWRIIEGSWHHMAVAWDDSGWDLYLDGVLRRQRINSGLGLGESVPLGRKSNVGDWYFGVENTPHGWRDYSKELDGSVARVALFSQRLSEAQIQSLYSADSFPPGIRAVHGSHVRLVD